MCAFMLFSCKLDFLKTWYLETAYSFSKVSNDLLYMPVCYVKT